MTSDKVGANCRSVQPPATISQLPRDERAVRYKPRPRRRTKLDPFRSYLARRIAAAAPERIPASVLLGELRAARVSHSRAIALANAEFGTTDLMLAASARVQDLCVHFALA